MRAVRVKVIGREKRVRGPTRNAYGLEMLQLPTHEATERTSLLSKRSNAAARGLVPAKNENEKKSGHMIKLTE